MHDQMMVELISIRYLADSEESTASGLFSIAGSRQHLVKEESSDTAAHGEDVEQSAQNAPSHDHSTTTGTRICCCLQTRLGCLRSVSGALDSCRGGRTVPWSNIVLGTIIFIVASVMSIPLLGFFASSENDQRKMVRDRIAKQQLHIRSYNKKEMPIQSIALPIIILLHS